VKQALFQLSYDPELHKRISLHALTGKAVLLAQQSVIVSMIVCGGV
jgi:hypothetical protein